MGENGNKTPDRGPVTCGTRPFCSFLAIKFPLPTYTLEASSLSSPAAISGPRMRLPAHKEGQGGRWPQASRGWPSGCTQPPIPLPEEPGWFHPVADLGGVSCGMVALAVGPRQPGVPCDFPVETS